MTYVEGPTLREQLGRVSRLPFAEAVRLADDLLDAIDHAHRHGIVHRDVKPENIVLGAEGAVLLDFGIARAVAASGSDRLTRSGIAVGTSTYMSPEQITALKEIDHRSDIYSLGCVLFECVAGSPPFVHRNEAVVLQQHLTQPAPDLRTLRPDTPRELAEGVARALAEDHPTPGGRRPPPCARPWPAPGSSGGSRPLIFGGSGPPPLSRQFVADVLEQLRAALGDRYEVERLVGEGGMATVYLATDLRHGRKVAIKTLRAELAASIGADRFLREIRRRRQPAAPQRPRAVRLGRGERHPVLRDAVHRGRVPAGSAQPGAAASPPRRGADHARGRGGAGVRPRARRRPPRHQAREHPAPERPRPGGRLRHRAGGGRGRREAHPDRAWRWAPRTT